MARVRGLNDQQLDGLISRFEGLVGRVLRRIARAVARALKTAGTSAGPAGVSPDDLGQIQVLWERHVDAELLPAVAGVYRRASTALADQLAGFGHNIQALTALSAEEYLRQARNRLVAVEDTVWESARDQLVEGMQAGDSVPELAARVQAATGFDEARAQTIARTEVVAANNASSLATALLVGDPTMRKEWLATPDVDGSGCDERTRAAHCAADGQTRLLAEPFEVGGFPLMFPGDPAGPPDQTINCRCAPGYVLDEPQVASAGDLHLPGRHDQRKHGNRYTTGPDGSRVLKTRGGSRGTPARVAGEDIIGDRSRLRRVLADVPVYRRHGDPLMGALAAQIGFDGPAEQASQARIRQELDGGGRDLWRGVPGGDGTSAVDKVDQYQRGDMWYGTGRYGNGVYTTSLRAAAETYADDDPDGVHRVVLRGDARTIDGGDLLQEHAAFLRGMRRDDPVREVLADPGRYAMAAGYDAVVLEDTPIPAGGRRQNVIILNRTATLVEETGGRSGTVTAAGQGDGVTPGGPGPAGDGQLGGRPGGNLGRASGGCSGCGGGVGAAADLPGSDRVAAPDLTADDFHLPDRHPQKRHGRRYGRKPDVEPVRKSAPTPPADRFTPKLDKAVSSGVRDSKSGPSAASTIKVVTFNDGTKAIRKKFRTNSEGTAKDKADSAELVSALGRAMGVAAPEVHRISDGEIYSEYIAGVDAYEDPRMTEENIERLATSGQGRILGLVDLLTDYDDRDAPTNWLYDNGYIVPLDNDSAWTLSTDPSKPPPAKYALSPFSRPFVAGKDWATNDLTRQEITEVRRRLETLRPRFAERGRQDWLEFSLARLDAIAARSRFAAPGPVAASVVRPHWAVPVQQDDDANGGGDFHLPGQHRQQDHDPTQGRSFPGMVEAGPADRDAFRVAVGKAIPPAWTDVWIADDLDTAKLLARGKDVKGRVQAIYSAQHTAGQAEVKFTRIRELAKYLDKLDHAVERDAVVDDDAAALLLIRRLGMRPGSTRDTGADKQAHGATTLLARHVTVDGDQVEFDFTGKKGVHIRLSVTDPLIAEAVRARLATRSGEQPLFDTTEARVRAYMRSTGVPGEFLLKDLRTVRANVVALQEIKARGDAAPTSKAEFRRWRRQVAEKVAAQLGNTPTLALSAYINPVVFTPWLRSEDWA